MLRSLLKLTPIVTFALMTFILVAKVIGDMQTPNPALRGFTEGCDDKPQPCWYGIVPGLTDMKHANDLLIQYHYPTQCVNIGNTDDIVTDLELWPCAILPPLYLGNIVSQFGQVQGISSIPNTTDIIYDNELVIFKNQYVSAEINFIYWLKDRFVTVVPIRVTDEPNYKIDLKWYGNVPRWKLCQLEPQYYVCTFCKAFLNDMRDDLKGACK